LRGIAALVVVFHHVYQIAKPYIEPKVDAWVPGSFWWFLSATPIKLLSAGSEAVLVFFVLSGLVVPLPLLGKGVKRWIGFYFSRLVRLYLPVWASLVLAAVWITVLPHPAGAVAAGSWTADSNSTAVSLKLLLSEGTLIRKSFSTNSVLWSLSWEMLFSLLLPLFVLGAYAVRRYWMLAIAVCFTLTIVGRYVHVDALLYLPVFFMGTLVAVNLSALRNWAERFRAHRYASAVGWATLGVSLCLVIAAWLLRPVVSINDTFASFLIGALTPLGALGLVACAIAFSPVRSGLGMRVPQFLGKISFSLYLTHLPILITLAYLFGDNNWALVGVVGVPLALGIAYLFYRFVESPSHSLAQRVGRFATWASGRVYVRLRARHVARLAATRTAEPVYR
jgi:peptidoglycan/LPS O-acetylase OafA/YrhL